MNPYISADLLSDLDGLLGTAIAKVMDGEHTKASVSLSFSIGFDKENHVEIRYSLKGSGAREGSWNPPVQSSLPFDPTAPDEEADREAAAWRPGTTPLERDFRRQVVAQRGVPDFYGDSEVITQSEPDGDRPYTEPRWSFHGGCVNHRRRLVNGALSNEALCGAPVGREGWVSGATALAACRPCEEAAVAAREVVSA